MTKSIQAVLLTAVASGALCAGAAPARAATYLQTDLVSDLSTLGAEVTDPNLKNSWGLSFQPNGPVWVSDQGTQNATIYGVTGATVSKESLTVAIPPSGPGVLGPTGQVANTNTSAFDVSGTGKSALFIFANLNGSISAWNGSAGTKAVTETTASGAAYTGLAINQAGTMLYAANGAGTGGIDIFNGSFAPATLPAGAFATPTAIKTAGTRAVQRQRHQRQGVCDLCAGRSCRRGKRRQGNGRVGRFQRGWDAGKQLLCRRPTPFALGPRARPFQLRSVRRRPAGWQLQLRRQRHRRPQPHDLRGRGRNRDQRQRPIAGRSLVAHVRGWRQ